MTRKRLVIVCVACCLTLCVLLALAWQFRAY